MKKIIKRKLACPYFPKISLKMKITTILLLVSLLKIQANTYSQNTKITLNVKEETVGQIFNKIETVSEFRFLYESDKIDLNRKITLNVDHKNILDVLQVMFKGTDVVYKTNDRQVLLTIKQKVLSSTAEAESTLIKSDQISEISGVVSDQNNVPIPGVNIVVKGTTAGTQTDINGYYSLKLPKDAKILVVSFIGYDTKEIEINNQAKLNIKLVPTNLKLEEVVVVGYGSSKQKDLTGAVSSLKSDNFFCNSEFKNIFSSML
jgi:hypothetical protein